MNDENTFFRDLAEVPEVPANVYPLIERKILHRSRTRTALYALAASIIVGIGTMTIATRQPSRSGEVQPEVASELQTIHDYLNSSDLEGDLDLYAVVAGY
jgi:hypothetical protein